MQIWNYDRETGELLGSSTADPDPMNDGGWLLPAHSTPMAPPDVAARKTALAFNGQSWALVADHRGETWWMADAKDNTQPFVIGCLGDPKTFEPPMTNAEPSAPPVVVAPVVVTAAQIRMALTRAGLRSQVEAYVASADQDTKDLWGFAIEFPRGNGMIETAATALGKTPEEIDALFELAKTL